MKKIIVSKLVIIAGLFLAGCRSGTINTAVSVAETETAEDSQVTEKISSYFERNEYSPDERDEMFYIIENHSDETIEISEFYFVQKLEEDEWITVDNNTINQIDDVIKISPDESAEFVFWMSFDSIDFEPGTYRLYTRMNDLDLSEQTGDDEHPIMDNVRDIYIPFEIL